MAKVKRYNGEEDGSFIEAGSGTAEEKPEGGRFDEETYARARRFLERGGQEETPKPVVKSTPKAKPKVVAKTPAPDLDPRIPTRERLDAEAAAQVPRSKLERLGSELSENVGKVTQALGPTAGVTRALGAAGRGLGALASSAKAGLQAGRTKAAQRSAELAGELRRGQTPTKFDTGAKLKPRVKKFNEDEASVEFKKGGAARGWGKARGARKAKIY